MSKIYWDSRFHIISSRDNKKVHEYFREYFDKPSRHRQVRISVPANPSKFYPNLSSTLEKFSNRIPNPARLGVKHKKSKELGWDPTFQVKISKDNPHFYSTYREYFDTPRNFNHNVSVVSTVPASAHGYQKVPERRYSTVDPKSNWNEIYKPISENNTVKYKTLRNYFESSNRD